MQGTKELPVNPFDTIDTSHDSDGLFASKAYQTALSNRGSSDSLVFDTAFDSSSIILPFDITKAMGLEPVTTSTVATPGLYLLARAT